MEKRNNFQNPTKLKSKKKKSFISALTGCSLMLVIIVSVMLFHFSVFPISASNAPNFVVSEQQFNLDATYAYVGKDTRNATVTDSQGQILRPISQYPSAVYFNVTRPTIENSEYDAVLEVFNITILSDLGPTEHFIFFTGTNYNPSFSDEELEVLTRGIYYLFDVDAVDGVSGMFCSNWTDDDSFLSAKVGSYGTYTNYKNGLGLWSEGKPNTISVSYFRIGFVTITNGAVSINPTEVTTNDKTSIQLNEECADGFLKNELVSIDPLSEQNRFEPIN